MLTIIIGTIGVLVLVQKLMHRMDEFWAGVIGSLLILLIIIATFFLPLCGFEKWELVEEREVESVTVSKEEVYKYKVKFDIENQLPIWARKGTAKADFIEVIEDSECEKPVVRRYISKSRRNIFTYGGFWERSKIEFYVPPGMISQEELNN